MIKLEPLDGILDIPATVGNEQPPATTFTHCCDTFYVFHQGGLGRPTAFGKAKPFQIKSDFSVPELFAMYRERLDVAMVPQQIPAFVAANAERLVGENRPNLILVKQDTNQAGPALKLVSLHVICLGNSLRVKLYTDDPGNENKVIEAISRPRLFLAQAA